MKKIIAGMTLCALLSGVSVEAQAESRHCPLVSETQRDMRLANNMDYMELMRDENGRAVKVFPFDVECLIVEGLEVNDPESVWVVSRNSFMCDGSTLRVKGYELRQFIQQGNHICKHARG